MGIGESYSMFEPKAACNRCRPNFMIDWVRASRFSGDSGLIAGVLIITDDSFQPNSSREKGLDGVSDADGKSP